MGNSQTKESRATAPRRRSQQWSPGASDAPGRSLYQGSRSGRSSRPDLSILGIGSSHDRDVATLEYRRETKQEREARRLEKERAARVKERERSMKEEHVDGGYVVTQGVYVGTEDFNKAVVRQLMVSLANSDTTEIGILTGPGQIERRLAPFWRGLNDFSDSWAEHQLMAAARGIPIPPPDEIPPELEYTLPKVPYTKSSTDASNIQNLTVPITSRSQSYNSDVSQNSNPAQSLPSTASPIAPGTSTSPLFRTRAKTLAALTTSSKHSSQTDLTPRELRLPKDPFVNGQPIEVYLYKDATECPICFLYYPPYLNRTRCCDQPICSECFVQIKRPDPHPSEHGEPDPNAPAQPEGERAESAEAQLISEPSACPFCVQPEFGVTYAPPPFRRGLTYAADPSVRPSPNITSPVSSTSSLSSANVAPIPGRRRATSLSANDPAVVTTDKVRPDWAQKLANARAHAARRSAAATALHAAAYLMNSGTSSDSRGLGLGRRGLRRGTQGDSGRTGSPALNALAFLTERPDRTPVRVTGPDTDSAEEGPGNIAPPRDSSRRSRIDDLEEMMMMEAIRLSLASEEERRRREEKEVKKEAKKREKEAKKADKVARKTGLYNNNASTSVLDVPGADFSLAKVASSPSAIGDEAATSGVGKGKGVDRATPSAALEPGLAASSNGTSALDPPPVAAIEQPASTEPSRPSHLRNMSSASSSFSSVMENTPDERTGSHVAADGSNTSLEPMFNFRSLAAVIGDEEKGNESEHVEDAQPHAEGSSSATPSVNQPTDVAKPDPTPVEDAPVDVQSSATGGVLPKELETRSVEITPPATNPETTL
ncbi:uncharacterized protein N7459_006777 [Penicillium hispanicum]|uniref:uncharacterized protein n=1 Tax=Penicillium hispanicum TaxID=1080232 RepID=UPI0025401C24|nr:uncharacterized protein N7459_006777 [Penicillium hispanicum]KAJ5577813.1 hypothetical protein N7459_006777 [Penicillium hispanicum]